MNPCQYRAQCCIAGLRPRPSTALFSRHSGYKAWSICILGGLEWKRLILLLRLSFERFWPGLLGKESNRRQYISEYARSDTHWIVHSALAWLEQRKDHSQFCIVIMFGTIIRTSEPLMQSRASNTEQLHGISPYNNNAVWRIQCGRCIHGHIYSTLMHTAVPMQ